MSTQTTDRTQASTLRQGPTLDNADGGPSTCEDQSFSIDAYFFGRETDKYWEDTSANYHLELCQPE